MKEGFSFQKTFKSLPFSWIENLHTGVCFILDIEDRDFFLKLIDFFMTSRGPGNYDVGCQLGTIVVSEMPHVNISENR